MPETVEGRMEVEDGGSIVQSEGVGGISRSGSASVSSVTSEPLQTSEAGADLPETFLPTFTLFPSVLF